MTKSTLIALEEVLRHAQEGRKIDPVEFVSRLTNIHPQFDPNDVDFNAIHVFLRVPPEMLEAYDSESMDFEEFLDEVASADRDFGLIRNVHSNNNLN